MDSVSLFYMDSTPSLTSPSVRAPSPPASKTQPSSPSQEDLTCLNDYRPVALTPSIMKCFERVVLAHIQSSMPDTLDPLRYPPTGPPQTPLLLPSIFPSLTWKITTPSSRCSLLTSAPPSTRGSPVNSPTNCLHLDYTPHSATGS